MKRDIQELTKKEYDLIVVGAGAFGACAAWDAVSRGLSVALVERGDFCHATSANHLKMVHGGIRYIQHADIYRVRESCKERTALLRIAPHLVQPIPIVMPTYGHGMNGKEILHAGILLYDLTVFDRNKGIKDPARRIPDGRLISRTECLDLLPDLDKKGLTGAAIFYDGQMYNPPRLALSFLRSASTAGACVGNYLEVTDFLQKANRVSGVKVQNILDGDKFEIRGKMVLNASGPWANNLLRLGLGQGLKSTPSFSRDTGFVVTRRLTGDYGFACQVKTNDPDAVLSREGRHIFIVPWRDCSLLGSWHVVYKGEPDEFTVSEHELQSFLDDINEAYPKFGLKLEDISIVNSGLTLFGENVPRATDLSYGKRSLLIDHAKEHNVDGLLTLIGVRATTARGTAEKAIDLTLKKLGKKATRSKTSITTIYGGKIRYFEEFLRLAIEQHTPTTSAEVIRSLVHNYGSEYGEVLKYIDQNPSWAETVGNTKVLKAEIVHAVREEMVQKLGDVIFRRTDLGTGRHPGVDALQTCADLMAKELEWDENRTQKELEEVKTCFPMQYIEKKYLQNNRNGEV